MLLLQFSIIVKSDRKGFISMGSRHTDIYERIQHNNLTIQNWVEVNYVPFQQACFRIASGDPLWEELVSYCMITFLEHKDRALILESGGAFYFCLRIATNAWNSTTSPFYTTWRKRHEEITSAHENILWEDPVEETGSFETQIDKILMELDWYSRELFRVHVAHGTNASALSRELKIPRKSISLTVNRVKTHIKQRLKYE
jgi:DNA-directed RNA polymerase specialized sigma24 family protein